MFSVVSVCLSTGGRGMVPSHGSVKLVHVGYDGAGSSSPARLKLFKLIHTSISKREFVPRLKRLPSRDVCGFRQISTCQREGKSLDYLACLHGPFKSICRSGANPEKTLRIRGGAMQVYHHNQ